jgi:uncharacterized repeat protein (TIGR03806 family)
MHKFLFVTALTLLLVAAFSCRNDHTNPPPTTFPTTAPTADYLCQFTESPITIDGKADEPAWQRAAVIDHFTMPWLGPDKRPRLATRAKLLWDREYFYFFADMDDPDLFTTVTEHNGRVWENDCFELFLKPAIDKPGYYEFEVSPANTTLELYIPDRHADNYTSTKGKHPFDFKTAVSLRGALNKHTDGGGWSVEGRVRWADLSNTGGRPNVDERWQFNLCRCDFTDANTSELSTIGSMKRRNFHQYEDYPFIRFAPPSGPKPYGMDSRLQWTRSHLVGYPEPPPPYHIEPAFPRLKIFQPVFVAEDPGTDDLLVIQHLGNWIGPAKIIRIRNDPTTDSSQTIYDGDELMYSLCFHPDYAHNRYVYLYSNAPVQGQHHFNRVTRYTMDRKTGKPDLATKQLVLEEWESNGHNGGGIAFGPDGLLYITTGDTTSDSDQASRGQDLRYLSSALLRVDVDHPDPGKHYSVPKDNPFLNTPGVRPEIYGHGFRNPWRLDIDQKTGAIWIGQNGQDLWEQVYVVQKGANYGWPVYEGSHPFHPHRTLETRTKFTKPTIEHHHSEARSITGGIVYYGDKYPDLTGAYIYGDFSTGRIWAAKYDGRQITWHKEIAKTTAQITNFYADKHGDIFVCDDAGGVFKIAPTPTSTPTPKFPRLLSETGLFIDTAKHQPEPGLIPYDVNSPLWSDNASKQRFIALPGDAKIDPNTSRGWNFPDGAALVKTFSLDMKTGDPKSCRRLETRVMLRQGGQWTGYTYIWNDAQTDAELAPASGVDVTYTVDSRQQTWHYPSRAECLVCHSRAANFVLGLSSFQMNRNFDYGHGRIDNQIRNLEHLGLFTIDYAPALRERLKNDLHAKGVNSDDAAKRAEELTDTTGQREAGKSSLLTQSLAELPHLADPADAAQSLNARARSYLQANCAHCHVEAGGGNASVDLEFTSDAAKTKMFDSPAQSNLLGTPDAKLIATGHPEKSIIYHRMTLRGTGQMPPVGSNVVDTRGAALIKEWIAKMPASTRPTR